MQFPQADFRQELCFIESGRVLFPIVLHPGSGSVLDGADNIICDCPPPTRIHPGNTHREMFTYQHIGNEKIFDSC